MRPGMRPGTPAALAVPGPVPKRGAAACIAVLLAAAAGIPGTAAAASDVGGPVLDAAGASAAAAEDFAHDMAASGGDQAARATDLAKRMASGLLHAATAGLAFGADRANAVAGVVDQACVSCGNMLQAVHACDPRPLPGDGDPAAWAGAWADGCVRGIQDA